jgi:anaerobic sulfite reductase subunit A
MSYCLKKSAIDELFTKIGKDYLIYGPTLIKNIGRLSDTDSVRYAEVNSIDELELKRKTDYSFKDIIFPISEVLFYYNEDGTMVPNPEHSGAIVFLRSCDLHALKRLDQIFLENGKPDYYYSRLRENIKFVLIPCRESFENCFCVSMESNIPVDYDLSLELVNDEYLLSSNDEYFTTLLEGQSIVDYTVPYVKENIIKVKKAKNIDTKAISASEMWREYDSRCIACGRCNLVCPTCTCWTMQDIHYGDNQKAGERRRVQASCMIDNFDRVAGGHIYRAKNGDRMRYKALHKIHDHRQKFGIDMCVGCGLCDDICPEYISFSNILNKIAKESM